MLNRIVAVVAFVITTACGAAGEETPAYTLIPVHEVCERPEYDPATECAYLTCYYDHAPQVTHKEVFCCDDPADDPTGQPACGQIEQSPMS